MNRRRFLGSAATFATMASFPITLRAQARSLRFADMHSHIGMRKAVNLREEMTKSGMLLVARKIVADGPVIRSVPGQGWRLARDPQSGELAKHFDASLERMRAQHKEEELVEVDSAGALDRAIAATAPAVVLAAEGGDFLEGDLKRLQAARNAGLIHLQLV